MTRFLSRILDDPLCGTLNEETQRLFAYHQSTKHTYHSVRMNAHYLDWSNQPGAFRAYDGAPSIELPPDPGFPNVGTFAAMAALSDAVKCFGGNSGAQEQIIPDLGWLSRFLWHSMAVSAWKEAPGGHRYSLRVNPSSGNLHPTETYLALRGFKAIGDGLYHYRADRHALELRSPGAWTGQLSQSLEIPWAAQSQLIVGLTSIFWREAWKYRDRAYRYCCHDLGHAMLSLLLAARALGVAGGAVAHFGDLRMTGALGLTGGDEAPMAFLVFPSGNSFAPPAEQPEKTFAGIPNELSTEKIPNELLLEMHCSTILCDSAGPAPAPPVDVAAEDRAPLPAALPEPARDAPLGEIARRRRSALDFDPRTPLMEREDAEQILDFATRDWRADWRGNFHGHPVETGRGIDFVALYLYVHRVRGYEPGVYRWDRSARGLIELHCGNVQRVAAFLSLEQPLAGNSCFTVSMIADLAKAAQVFGNRGYRYVYFEAGAIGQRLYLGAEALGWNATGIGAFYDDDVHRYLGFLEEDADRFTAAVDAAEKKSLVMLDSPASRQVAVQGEYLTRNSSAISGAGAGSREETTPRMDPKTLPRQVIYHFAVGRAIPDPRIEA